MSGDVENGETSTLLGERLKVRLDENFDGLFAGMDLDTDSLVAKVNFMAASVPSSNDSLRHGFSLRDRRQHYAAFDRSQPIAVIRTGFQHRLSL